MVGPDIAPLPAVMVPFGLRVNAAGAPTRLSTTSPGAGGLTPLSESLASTLAAEVPPGAMPASVSSPASRVPLLTFSVACAVAQSVAFGAARQTW